MGATSAVTATTSLPQALPSYWAQEGTRARRNILVRLFRSRPSSAHTDAPKALRLATASSRFNCKTGIPFALVMSLSLNSLK